LYEGLGLKPLIEGVRIDAPDTSTKPVPTATPQEVVSPTPPSPADIIPQNLKSIFQALKKWREGEPLIANNANRIRNALLSALDEEIDWDLQCKQVSLASDNYKPVKWIYIANASGGEPTCDEKNSLATVATQKELEDTVSAAQVELNLRAVLMRQHHGSWSYPTASGDIAHYYNFIDQLRPQANQFIHERFFRDKYQAVHGLTTALSLGAKVLDLPKAYSQRTSDRISAIFTPSKDPGDIDLNSVTEWEKTQYVTAKQRNKIREYLLLIASARQGSGQSIYAVDAHQILNAEEDPASPPQQLQELRDTLRAFKSIDSTINSQTTETQKWLNSFNEEICQKTLSQEQKDIFVQQMRDLITQVASDFRDKGHTKERLRKDLKWFKESAICDQTEQCNTLLHSEKRDDKIRALTKLDLDLLSEVADLITHLQEFICESDLQVTNVLDEHGEDGGYKAITTAIDASLNSLLSMTTGLNEEVGK